MKQSWHTLAARCAAAHPHWSWQQVCAAVASRKRAKPTPPTPQQAAAKLEQRNLW